MKFPSSSKFYSYKPEKVKLSPVSAVSGVTLMNTENDIRWLKNTESEGILKEINFFIKDFKHKAPRLIQ